jgi:hypothetical protein
MGFPAGDGEADDLDILATSPSHSPAEVGRLLVEDPDSDDEDSFVPRYIPAGGGELSASVKLGADEEAPTAIGTGVQDLSATLEVRAASPLAGNGEVDRAVSLTADLHPSPSAGLGMEHDIGGALPGSVDDSAPPAEAEKAAIERKGSERGKKNWAKLKVANKVGNALNSINQENKMYGVTNENDDATDWTAITKQDMSKKPFHIILPDANARIWWDMYMGLLLAYVAGYVPYRVAFLVELTDFWSALEIWVDASFGVSATPIPHLSRDKIHSQF